MDHRAKQVLHAIVLFTVVIGLPWRAEGRPSPSPNSLPGTLRYRCGGHAVSFSPLEVQFESGDRALRIEFVGARAVPPIAADPGVPEAAASQFVRVSYPVLWDGISLVYDAPGGLVRSTYVLAPAADPGKIRLRYSAPVTLGADGGLRIAFAAGVMRESAPVAWQDIDGRRVPVSVAFRKEPTNEVGFALGPYDRDLPLVIDPTLAWNTFLGGPGVDHGSGIAVDAGGNVYVTGNSGGSSWGDPLRPFSGGWATFVAKLDPAGTLLWNTFLGGTNATTVSGTAIDAEGNIYLTGVSDGTWSGAIRPWDGTNGNWDAFVAKIDPDGTLLWHTFLGTGNDYGFSVAADSGGHVYVTGMSGITWGDPIRPISGGGDAFVAKLDADGALLWNTFLGGTRSEGGYGIAFDAKGNVFVAGNSDGAWGSPIQPRLEDNEMWDVFIAKIDADGALLWNTFVGGLEQEVTGDIATDALGNVYVTGISDGAWGNPILPFKGYADAFLVKLDTSGAQLWNTFLGGDDGDGGIGIAVGGDGCSYVIGDSNSSWGNPVRPWTALEDAFVAKLDPAGRLVWNTFLGGVAADNGVRIALDGVGDVSVVGRINNSIAGVSGGSWGDPIRPYAGGWDAFVAKLANTPPVAVDQELTIFESTPTAITLSATDADGDALSYEIHVPPAHGTLGGGGSRLTYVPAAGFVGLDSFTFTASDGHLDSNTGTVTITVLGVDNPPIGSVMINDREAVTRHASVTLTLEAEDDGGGPIQMCISNAPVCTRWTPFAKTKPWNVTPDSGIKTVYAWFRDSRGNTSSAVSDTILLDREAPVSGKLAAQAGAGEITLSWGDFSDSLSGIVEYRVVFSTGAVPSSCATGTLVHQGASTTTSFVHAGLINAVYSYRACAIDAAGNISSGATRRVRPFPAEEDSPTGAVTINGGGDVTNSRDVTLDLSAVDASPPIRVCMSNTPACEGWAPFVNTKKWKLPPGNGMKTVYVWYRDTWGNKTSAATDTLLLDMAAPKNGTLTVTPGTGEITLKWGKFSDSLSGIGGYRVVYSTASGPTSCRAGTVAHNGPSTITSFTHAVSADLIYRYRVCAIDAAGNMSSGVTGSAKPNP